MNQISISAFEYTHESSRRRLLVVEGRFGEIVKSKQVPAEMVNRETAIEALRGSVIHDVIEEHKNQNPRCSCRWCNPNAKE